MNRIIASTARISAKTIKDGSNIGRNKFCQKLEDKFYNRLKKYKHTQFDYISKNIHEILPTKLIQIDKLPQNEKTYDGAVMIATQVEKIIPADVVGYIVTLKPGHKKEHFGGVKIEVLMHEIHHLFNYFTHPKIPNRIYKISKIPSDNNFEKFFVENFQSPMQPYKCKTQTEKLLAKECKHKIDLLQYFRYKLIDEIGAYQSGEHYANLFRKKMQDSFQSNIDTLYLHGKLADINIMLRNALKQERENLSKPYTK